jgi:DNA topoisomerase IA
MKSVCLRSSADLIWAVMPDYEYRQTVVTLPVPVGESAATEFQAVGRIPLRLGWKAVYQAIDPDGEAEAEQTLPSLSNGETAILSDPWLVAESRRRLLLQARALRAAPYPSGFQTRA